MCKIDESKDEDRVKKKEVTAEDYVLFLTLNRYV